MINPLERILAYLIFSMVGMAVIGGGIGVAGGVLLASVHGLATIFVWIGAIALLVGIYAWAAVTLLKYERLDRGES